jgi:hypothetical protein
VCFQTKACFLLWSVVKVKSTVLDSVREKSGLSKKDILKVYFNRNRRVRKKKVRKKRIKGWQGKKRSEACLGTIRTYSSINPCNTD